METAISTLQAQTSSMRLPKDLQQVCNRLAVPAPLQAIMTRGQQYAAISEIVANPAELKIAKVAQQQGSAPTRSSIIAMLIYMNIQLHLASSLTDDNIRAIADDLTNNPEIKWWLTLADVQLLCRNILNGTYAHYYNRFGLDTFYECFNKYCAERNDIHFTNADKTVTNPSEATLKMSELGYSLGPDGQLIVPEEAKERCLAQPLYLYNDKGKRIGINPKGAFGKKQASVSDTNNVMFLVKKMMKADRNLDLDEAIEMAKQQLNQATNTGSNEHQTTTAQ